ncbi:MAG: hypothetical protein IT349_07230 [Candidatus Eisenbacteria bacterium]|nr:hypothetical protein [Candidatus Eisenbacteria bacterium]MCC7141882.1 hypothetical protein [Candidatus Eisenbacteria bacterium]
MSLMLANRYFLDRDYLHALPLLEAALADASNVSPIRKKLIVTNIVLGRLSEALDLLEQAVHEDPRSIIDTQAEDEDCPCPDLCRALEKRLPYATDPYPVLLSLGMLELYCSLERARTYLAQAGRVRADEPRIPRILSRLQQEVPRCSSAS